CFHRPGHPRRRTPWERSQLCYWRPRSTSFLFHPASKDTRGSPVIRVVTTGTTGTTGTHPAFSGSRGIPAIRAATRLEMPAEGKRPAHAGRFILARSGSGRNDNRPEHAVVGSGHPRVGEGQREVVLSSLDVAIALGSGDSVLAPDRSVARSGSSDGR